MNIVVSGEKEIGILQQEFHKEFPFLKIEFFQAKASGKQRIPANRSFGDHSSNNHSHQIIIVPSMTVAELEDKFLVSYNLSAQILRQSGKVWLETSLTDSWTLEEQNEQGKALSA